MQAEPFEIITVDGKQKTFLFFQFHGVPVPGGSGKSGWIVADAR